MAAAAASGPAVAAAAVVAQALVGCLVHSAVAGNGWPVLQAAASVGGWVAEGVSRREAGCGCNACVVGCKRW